VEVDIDRCLIDHRCRLLELNLGIGATRVPHSLLDIDVEAVLIPRRPNAEGRRELSDLGMVGSRAANLELRAKALAQVPEPSSRDLLAQGVLAQAWVMLASGGEKGG
jgi:hypothetical protein